MQFIATTDSFLAKKHPLLQQSLGLADDVTDTRSGLGVAVQAELHQHAQVFCVPVSRWPPQLVAAPTNITLLSTSFTNYPVLCKAQLRQERPCSCLLVLLKVLSSGPAIQGQQRRLAVQAMHAQLAPPNERMVSRSQHKSAKLRRSNSTHLMTARVKLPPASLTALSKGEMPYIMKYLQQHEAFCNATRAS